MSALGDAIKTIQGVVQLQFRAERLESSADRIAGDVKALASDLYSVDKRVVRIETMIEMTTGRGSQPPRLEEN
ncbi:hypothetical protein SAMN05518801_10689 [Novosphingobium sp. CF614]|uniref:hypothetical protein n=1 Tax=Novosphingobium sp. CF614 TaxID=1884364 RepID=UPI0008E7A886|nr:hypothetical protein [Novosphingobium sp. CF614]SFG04484.1 hypothetical protein SAMN05518801_10689 [Novosphingobium sp. CF614]